MHEYTLIGLLSVSFAMGLVHAFDADHVVAVSSLAGRRQRTSGFLYALQWALGHGGVLLLIAFAALCLRAQLPDYVPHTAEKLVGLILIFSGLSIFWSLHRQRAGIRLHRHGDVVHAHLAAAEQPVNHDHAPMLVGVVHGLAGSAPALALIPATLYQPVLGLGYILIFSAGVLAGMLTFGLLLGYGQRHLLALNPRLWDHGRAILGAGATVLGLIWLGAH